MATVRKALSIAGFLILGLAHATPPDTAAARPETKAARIVKPGDMKNAAGNQAVVAEAGSAKLRPAPVRMQVEEPRAAPAGTASKVQPKAKQSGRTRALTESQKQAFRDRKEKMEGMIAVIKQKREAMAAAKPEDRAAIAHELHTLMLEKDPVAANALAASARVEGDASPAGIGEKDIGDAVKEEDSPEKRHRQNEWRRQREHRK
ncbi:MAG: hypothetical protein ABI036_04800 [Fibrobacteria bacterium]